MYIEENIGKETSEPGSIKQAGRKEDFKPEELRQHHLLPDLSINLDHQSDAKPLDIATDPDSEEDSLLLKLSL